MDDKKPEIEDEKDTPTNETRTGIMLKLSPAIEKVLKDEGLDMTRPDLMRRYFRAMVHLAAKKLLDAGAPPDFLVAQTIEAIGHELEARKKLSDEGTVPPSTALN